MLLSWARWNGGQWSLAVALIVECWPERHRPKLAGLLGCARTWYLAHCLDRTYTTDHAENWRWMMLVGAAPAVLALLISFAVPESERWKEASKKGGRSPLIEIFRPGLRKKTLLAICFASIPLIGTWAAIAAGRLYGRIKWRNTSRRYLFR